MKWRPDPSWAARLAAPVIAALARTWRVEVIGSEQWTALSGSGRPFIFLLWHEVLLPLLWHHRRQGIAIMVSEARDGRYLSELAARWGYRRVHGSSTRGGTRALLGAVRALQEGTPVAITPDGPRGPRRELKSGILAAAEKSGAPILPIHATADRAWRLRSWDRFLIPRPFARVRIGYGAPLLVTPGEVGLDPAAEAACGALEALERLLG
jgi:hypothetical protein